MYVPPQTHMHTQRHGVTNPVNRSIIFIPSTVGIWDGDKDVPDIRGDFGVEIELRALCVVNKLHQVYQVSYITRFLV